MADAILTLSYNVCLTYLIPLQSLKNFLSSQGDLQSSELARVNCCQNSGAYQGEDSRLFHTVLLLHLQLSSATLTLRCPSQEQHQAFPCQLPSKKPALLQGRTCITVTPLYTWVTNLHPPKSWEGKRKAVGNLSHQDKPCGFKALPCLRSQLTQQSQGWLKKCCWNPEPLLR